MNSQEKSTIQKTMKFVSIDVETANPDQSSICQIGVVIWEDGQIIDEWCTLVNPCDYFDYWNVSIHGITEESVEHSPKFTEVYEHLKNLLSGQYVVHHSPFDRVAIQRAVSKANHESILCNWLDTARIVRRTYSEFAKAGYGLANLADHFGYSFNHHDALEDARMCGNILLRCLDKSKMSISDWPTFLKRRITLTGESYAFKGAKGNPDGELYGEIAVFTGKLRIPRKEAAAMAAEIGIEVKKNVSNSITMLIVGIQDAQRVGESGKSGNQKDVEEKIAEGADIKILSEDDFEALFQSSTDT